MEIPSPPPLENLHDPTPIDFTALLSEIKTIPVSSPADYRRFVFRTVIAERLKDSGFEPRFITDGFSAAQKQQAAVFARTTASLNRKGAIVVLCGPRGLGKTTIAAQIACDLFWQDWQSAIDKADSLAEFVSHRIVSYRKLTAVLGKLKALYGDFGTIGADKLESYRDHLASVDLLVLDEMNEGAEDSKFKDRICTDLIDRRYAARRDTILITNQPPDEFQKTINSSILSRLNEHGAIVECNWPSFRD